MGSLWNSYEIPMESLWNPYGIPMESQWQGWRDTGRRQADGSSADGDHESGALLVESELWKLLRPSKNPSVVQALFGEYTYMYIYVYIYT